MTSVKKHCSDEVDRISDLPESIRCHILSLLPTTDDAVATSLLSTKWKSLWRNVNNLSFYNHPIRFRLYTPEERHIKFSRFVNKVLIFLNEQSVNQFVLRVCGNCELYDVNTWISAAVIKNVRVLELLLFQNIFHNDIEQIYALPGCLFTSKTLEVLILRDEMHLEVPNFVSLPNLKRLHLFSMIYECDESVTKLISGCPSLETMYIGRIPRDNLVNCIIISPTLRRLTLEFIDVTGYVPGKLVINAPQLRYLDLADYLSVDFSFENLCLLDEARLDLSVAGLPLDYDYSTVVAKLLQGVYNVKNLSLKSHMHQLLSHVSVYPCFSRLTQLTVEVESADWNSLLNLVFSLNKLESLTLEGFDYERDPHVIWIEPEKVPICLLSSLKAVSITNLEDSEDELMVVAYILKHAKVLRKFTMKVAGFYKTRSRLKLLQKVSKFPRGSEECELHFLD